MKRRAACPVLTTLMLLALSAAPAAADEPWISIFNGRDLQGWQAKIAGYPLGENFGDTFRVEDGLLKVAYDKYDKFGTKFGHIFYHKKLSNYRIRVEYRFVGEQCSEGPGWAVRNSGIMFHCQAPETMRVDQSFPVSIEAQLLGGNGKDDRPTGNVCTPGTHIEMRQQLVTRHCNNSQSPTYHGDQWVTMEVEVRRDGRITHRVNGEIILQYENPQLDDSDADAKALIRDGNKLLTEGYISLQAESHPIEFRKIEIQQLD